jgi:hypothetical protein
VGEEAQVLYEAMRVGAADGAVLGTIHGGGGESVRERVVIDLGVPETAFADTDFVVTVEAYDDGDGRTRRLRTIEAVRRTDDGVDFEMVADGGGVRLDDSPAIADLAAPNETTTDVRTDIEARAERLDGWT